MRNPVNRRGFLGTTLATGTFAIVPRHVLGGAGYVPPSEKLNLAHIGMGTQSIRELGGLLADPRVQITAVCDPNRSSDDYLEWGKGEIKRRIREYLNAPSWGEGRPGCPGGREVGREVIEGFYAAQRQSEGFRGVATYADFREMLAAEQDLDAVRILIPDHQHAAVAIAAMKHGKHVALHKPLANRLAEGRLVVDTARRCDVATHLLAYGSGRENGRIVAQIRQGVIGPLREIHNWTNRPVWPQYTAIPQEQPPVPEGFDWKLWLGPETDRPYHPWYTHTTYRGWYDFGGGSMADMGIYSLWPVFTGLELGVPESAEAWATHTCRVVDQVCGTEPNPAAYPTACTIRLHFGKSPHCDALDLFWYDGGMKPRLPAALEAHDVTMDREGILFVGDDGAVLADFHGANPRLFAGGKAEPLRFEASGSEAGEATSRQVPWVDACLGGEPSPGRFETAAAITDAVNLGTVALRAGRKVRLDSQSMRISDNEPATALLSRGYRAGWEL